MEIPYRRGTERNVTLDSNILIAYIISKRDNTVVKRAVMKSVTEDRLMLTDVIFDECIGYTKKRKAIVTCEEVSEKLKGISSEIIMISPVPSDEELIKKYKIRDKGDLKILYSAETTDSVIIVTRDKDFSDVEGIRAQVMNPKEYLEESTACGNSKKQS